MKTFLAHFCLVLALLFSTHALCAVEAEPSAVFSGAQGSYAGNVQTGDGNFLNAGALIVVLEATGRFSANLNWQGLHYPFFGKFDAGTATFHRQFNDHSEPGSTLVLDLTLNAGARTIDCNLGAERWLHHISRHRATFRRAPRQRGEPGLPGHHEYLLHRSSRLWQHPAGHPRRRLFHRAHQQGERQPDPGFVGRLPDTAPFACGSLLRGTTYSVFSMRSIATGLGFGGQVFGEFDASDPSSLNSVLQWAKRAGANPNYYPAGFNTGVGLITIGYGKSVAVHSIPHISTTPGPVSATLTLTDGNLGVDSSNVDIVFTAQIKISLFGVKVSAPNPQHITVHTDAPGARLGRHLHSPRQRPANHLPWRFHRGA